VLALLIYTRNDWSVFIDQEIQVSNDWSVFIDPQIQVSNDWSAFIDDLYLLVTLFVTIEQIF